MIFKLFKKREYDSVVQTIFRIIVLLVTIFYFASVPLLPEENDEFFEVNLSKKYDFEISEEDVLYKGSFEILTSDNVFEPITLPTKVIVPANERVSIRSIIPDDYNEDYIVIRSSQENLTIFIDGKARVIYNTEVSRPYGSQTTSRYVFCRTSDKDAGKELRIALSSPSPDYSCTINEVYSGDRFIIWKYFFQKCETNLIFGLTGIGIGLFVVCIGFCISILMGMNTGLENVGWCIFFVGICVICESKIRQLLTPNASSLSNICFIVIMLGVIPMLLYMNQIQGKRYEVIYRSLINIAFINMAAQLILQFLNVFDFLDMLIVSHIILFVSVIVGISLIIVDARKGLAKEYKIMIIGLITMLICLFIEAGSVYFVTMASGVFMIFGVIVFTFSAMFDTIKKYREFEHSKQEERLRI